MRFLLPAALVPFVACAEPEPEPEPTAELWVSGYLDNAVVRLDADHEEVGRLDAAGSQAILPWGDGALVAAEVDGQILAFDGDGTRTLWADGLVTPTGLAELPDGSVAVASFDEDRVLRYDADGLFVEELVAGVDGPDAGLSVDEQGRLWVPCFESNDVAIVDDGAVVQRIPIGRPRVVRHDADGVAWISSWSLGRLRRYDADGTLIDSFLTHEAITAVGFDGPTVWVGSDQGPGIEQFDLDTAASLRSVDPGLVGVTFVQVVP